MTDFRRTTGIVSDDGDPALEADVIMTATLLGFTAWRLGDPADDGSVLAPLETSPVRFDADPGTPERPIAAADVRQLEQAVGRFQHAVAAYLGTSSPAVTAGLAGGWSEGACIMGVYQAAGQTAPDDIAKLEHLSKQGEARWKAIASGADARQYVGRGAYSGFVDDPNGQVVAGPLPTARFWASRMAASPERWVPALDPTRSPWRERVHGAPPTTFPWGIIGGDLPGAAQITDDMEHKYHMVFNGSIADDGVDVAMYPHGMIQAIYLAYGHGPSCRAYEIAVGSQTTKMASCVPCTFFMAASGYFPNAIHLGRGESWTPLFEPYLVPGTQADAQAMRVLAATIRDLNASWAERCLLWLERGLTILTDSVLADSHAASRSDVAAYVAGNRSDPTLGARLVLDAVTMHDSEISRLLRTLALLAGEARSGA